MLESAKQKMTKNLVMTTQFQFVQFTNCVYNRTSIELSVEKVGISRRYLKKQTGTGSKKRRI